MVSPLTKKTGANEITLQLNSPTIIVELHTKWLPGSENKIVGEQQSVSIHRLVQQKLRLKGNYLYSRKEPGLYKPFFRRHWCVIHWRSDESVYPTVKLAFIENALSVVESPMPESRMILLVLLIIADLGTQVSYISSFRYDSMKIYPLGVVTTIKEKRKYKVQTRNQTCFFSCNSKWNHLLTNNKGVIEHRWNRINQTVRTRRVWSKSMYHPHSTTLVIVINVWCSSPDDHTNVVIYVYSGKRSFLLLGLRNYAQRMH